MKPLMNKNNGDRRLGRIRHWIIRHDVANVYNGSLIPIWRSKMGRFIIKRMIIWLRFSLKVSTK